MSSKSEQVIVVGGGVIGSACAYFLSGAGCTVTIVDQGAFGRGCSHGNCGYVSPSHVLPMAGPGAVKKALKALLSQDSPFYIKPRLDAALWSWFWHFARRCNVGDMLESGQAIKSLLDSSRALYDQIIQAEAMDCEWQPRGMLFVLQTAHGMEHFAQTDRFLREYFDLGAKRIEADALTQFEPALKPGLAGGWFYENDAHLRPDKLMSSWKKVLEQRGVTIREYCAVNGISCADGKARAVATGQGELAADVIVFAAGAWTPLLSQHLGCKIPIQPGKGYSMTMPRPAICPTYPMLFEEHRVAVTPMHSGYRLGSTMEFAGYDTTLNPRRLAILKNGATHYLREPYSDPIVEEWYGWRPMTWDSRPIIDRSPALSNVWIAAGHNMLGVSMAPATGKLMAEMVTRGTPHIDPKPYAATRFGK
jgi:D-amino-acid dehydrogenase